MIHFRDDFDKQHFYGSGVLSLLGMVTFMFILPSYDNALATNMFPLVLVSYVCGIISSNILGILFESLENWVLPHHESEFWDNSPSWISDGIWEFLQKNVSGDEWDWIDIKMNVLGSTLFIPIIQLIKSIFSTEVLKSKVKLKIKD